MPTLPFPAHAYPELAQVVAVLLGVWPGHEAYVGRSLKEPGDLPLCEELSGMIRRLAGDGLAQLCADYRWTCDRLLEEEVHFRRNGTYRLTSFAEAEREVYGRPEFMAPYLNGLLLSHLVWAHHRRVVGHYRDTYLPSATGRHLEVGPGHGLLLHMAAACGRFGELWGWDVSPTSLERTALALSRLETPPVGLERCNILLPAEGRGQFDSIVMSEVLEHLEQPAVALGHLCGLLAPGGRIFLNVPVNSPAPDHITLFTTPEEVLDLVAAAGLVVVDATFFPVTGYDIDRARRTRSTISCAVTARHP